MNENILRILKMVEEKKITAEEATGLIAALQTEPSTTPSQATTQASHSFNDGFDRESFMRNDVKAAPGEVFLQVRVLSADGDKVKINLPLNFVKAVLKLTGKLPMIQPEHLEGIDVNELMETITAAVDSDLKGRIVDVESANGDLVVVEIV